MTISEIVLVAERAKELADKVGGQAMTLEEVADFHPEDGMVLANTTSVGMKPKVDLTPIPKVCLIFHLPRFRIIRITLDRQNEAPSLTLPEEF